MIECQRAALKNIFVRLGATQLKRVDKNSLPSTTILWKRRVALFCLLAMVAGLLFSRAIASISMMLFGIAALWGISPKQWLKERWWLIGLGWIGLYALSYFWSADKGEWNAHVQVKLPFLLLPLCFALLPRFSSSQWRLYSWGLALMMTSGAIYSISYFWQDNPADVVRQYVVHSHLLPTPMYNDHIAFSTAVAVTIAWIIFYLPNLFNRLERVLLGAISLFLAIYLHVLAAKTGLIALYIFLCGYIIYLLRKNLKLGIILLVTVVCLATLSILALPTLRGRIGYTLVTWRSYTMGERNALYGDASRMISYNLALRSIAQHPLAGVGAGDVLHEMKAGYNRWYPEVPEEQMLWPHNQWLTCAMAAGIPAALLFTIWLVAPLRLVRRSRAGAFFLLIWTMLLVPLIVDVFLEVQIGVAVFLIFLLVQWKMLRDERRAYAPVLL
jgi:O-antigen ligase